MIPLFYTIMVSLYDIKNKCVPQVIYDESVSSKIPQGNSIAAAVVDVPGAEADGGEGPDDDAARVEEGITGLVGRAKTGARWPEDESRSAA